MEQPTLFSASGQALRAQGQARMDNKDYAARLDVLLRRFLDTLTAPIFTADGLRDFAESTGWNPLLLVVHPNSWGALFTRAACAGLIRGTGVYVSSTNRSRRCGKIQVWERTVTHQ